MQPLLAMKVIKTFVVKYQLLVVNKTLKSHLVRAAFGDINEADRCEPCVKKIPPCQLCGNIKHHNFRKEKKDKTSA